MGVPTGICGVKERSAVPLYYVVKAVSVRRVIRQDRGYTPILQTNLFPGFQRVQLNGKDVQVQPSSDYFDSVGRPVDRQLTLPLLGYEHPGHVLQFFECK